jgi:hypothetical protein
VRHCRKETPSLNIATKENRKTDRGRTSEMEITKNKNPKTMI